MWSKIKNLTVFEIAASRFKKVTEDTETARKKSICKGCKFNSLNTEKIPLKKRLIKKLSDFYSKITGNAEKDILGNCLACKSCSVYYKILMNDNCKKGYWDK